MGGSQNTGADTPHATHHIPRLPHWGVFTENATRNQQIQQQFRAISLHLHAQPRALRRQLTRAARLRLKEVAMMLALGVSLPAQAAMMYVTTDIPDVNAGDGFCSLSEAIHNANNDAHTYGDCPAGVDMDHIYLPTDSMQVFTAAAIGFPGQALPSITSQLQILARNSTLKVASGVAIDTIFNVTGGEAFSLTAATITGEADSGTATNQPLIRNAETLFLDDVRILLTPGNAGLETSPGSFTWLTGVSMESGPGLGYFTGAGDAIRNAGRIILDNSHIRNLYTYDANARAVVINEGSLEVDNASITGCTGGSAFNGIDNAGLIRGSGLTLSNPGGYGSNSGLYNRETGELILQDSVISGNGGNKYNGSGGLTNLGTAHLTRVQLDNNFGGVSNHGDMELHDSSVSGNDGYWSGGLFNSGTLLLSGVTLAGNSGLFDAGFFNLDAAANARIINSTLVSNSGVYDGSGIFNHGTLSVTASTISANYSYGGISGVSNSGSLSLTHTLVTGGDIISNTGTVSGSEYNFFGDSSQTTAELFSGFTPGVMDITASSDGMLPTALADIIELEATSYGDVIPRLADNGGPTMTVALASGSPAMDAGAALCEDTDQRGIPRPQGGACDIGAVEIQATVAASCSSYTDYEARGCTGIYRIRNLADLAAYKASNYGLGSDGKYRYVRVVNSLGDGSQPLEIHSPCKITVAGPVTLRGSQVTVDGKRGVLMNWGSKIETDGSACLLTEKNSVELKGGHRVGAGALTLQSQRLSRIGPWSQVTVAGPVRLASLGTGTEAKVEIRNDSQVVADSLDLVAAYQAAIGGRVGITTAGDTRVEVGDVADSHAVLRYQSVLQTGGDLHFNSGGVSRLAAETEVSVGGTLEMNAGTAGQCRVAGSASILASDTTGNCARRLP